MTLQGQIYRSFTMKKYRRINFTCLSREIDPSAHIWTTISTTLMKSGGTNVCRLINFPQEASEVDFPILFHSKTAINLPL